MLTIFTIPKPFLGHNGIIQKNAIRSWLLLQPKPEVILFGNEEGTAEVAAELGTRHEPDIECSDYGTPLISSAFNAAQRLTSHKLFCFINTDIILMSDFLPAIKQITRPLFLVAGQRWDLDVTEPIDFTLPDWETQLRRSVTEGGKLHAKAGIDYFVFPRGMFRDIPPFAIGRTFWDNWLIYHTRALKAPVIDATGAITIIHQNHDYSHIKQKNGSPQPVASDDPKAPERKLNMKLAGGKDHGFTLEYATHTLSPTVLKPALTPRYLYFRMRAFPILYPCLRFLLPLFKAFERCVGIARSLAKKPAV